MSHTKVVLIGAGSASFGRGTIADLMACRELSQHTDTTLVLVDTDPDALEIMYRFARKLSEFHGSRTLVEATVDRCEALPDAHYVVTAVARERSRLWAMDFHVPLAYGFKNPYGECGGPGAAFHTLRSLHQVIPICRDMERLCPDALLLNFTNPESRVCLGVTRLTGLRSVGLCHGAASTLRLVADVLDRPVDEVLMSVGGINHFHWVLKLHDAATGEDMLPAFHAKLDESPGRLEPLTRYLYELYGRLPFPSDSHIAEYVSCGYEFVGPHYLAYSGAQERSGAGGAPSPLEQISQAVADDRPLASALAAASGEWAADIIRAHALDRPFRCPAANVPNEGGAIGNLPGSGVVEVPVNVSGQGIAPEPVPDLPEGIAALCRRQMDIQELLVQAYAEGSKRLLLQALLLEPIVDDAGRANGMMEELLRRQEAYLPRMS